MKSQQLITIAAILFVILAAGNIFAEELTTNGTISRVTVYRGQALVTRTISTDLPAGASEIIVKGLPSRIIPESIYAQSTGEVKVLSVRYREQAVGEDVRTEVKELDEQIEQLKNQIHHSEVQKGHLDGQWAMFIKLRDFVADAKTADLNRGLLQFEPIKGLAEFIMQKGQEYIDQTLKFEDEIVQLKKQLELLERKRGELTAGSARTEREAVLFISPSGNKKASFELNYLVDGANWLQQYNLRASPDKSNVLIEYNAVINQVSGENWDAVSLSLSTAEPTIVAEPPSLQPMKISLFMPQPVAPGQPGSFGPVIYSEQEVGRKIEQFAQSRKLNIKKGMTANAELNDLAMGNQAMIFNMYGSDIKQLQEKMEEIVRREGISVVYNIPGKLTLPSRNDQQLVSIASITAKADFTLVATPLLTDYVYLQGQILNDSGTVLLPGPASMFRNGEFVGKGIMPLVTMGEKFTSGFGIDSQVQVAHELVEKKTRVQGGNNIDTYSYRIALSNYKNTPVLLQLFDRLPYTEDPSIKIELSDTSQTLSDNAEYVRTAKKKGILRWDLKLDENTTGEKATVVTYNYTMEYDRNMKIRTLQQDVQPVAQ